MPDYSKIVSVEGDSDLEQDPLATIRRRWNLDGSVQLGAVPVPMRPLYVAIIRDMRWLVNEVVQSRIGMVSMSDDYGIGIPDNRPSKKKTKTVSTTKPKKRKLLVEKQTSLFDDGELDEGPDEEIVGEEE